MEVTLLVSDKASFRARKMIRDREGRYAIIKGSILQEDIIIPPVCAPNNRASKYMKQKLMKPHGETDKSMIIVGNFNAPLSVIDRGSRQKISKDTVDLSSTIDQLHLIDIFIRFHPTTAEYRLYSRSHSPRQTTVWTLKHT